MVMNVMAQEPMSTARIVLRRHDPSKRRSSSEDIRLFIFPAFGELPF